MKDSVKGMLVVAGAVIAAVGLFATGPSWGDDEGRGEEHGGMRASRVPVGAPASWKTECGSCHVPYPPAMLPAQSWAGIMAGLDRHFGENASLPPAVAAEIGRFLAAEAGRPWGGEGGVPRGEPPMRITETPWFRREHREIGDAVWRRASIGSPANCSACHRQAEQGIFNEHGVKIPK